MRMGATMASIAANELEALAFMLVAKPNVHAYIVGRPMSRDIATSISCNNIKSLSRVKMFSEQRVTALRSISICIALAR
jgi:hypothetical protein